MGKSDFHRRLTLRALYSEPIVEGENILSIVTVYASNDHIGMNTPVLSEAAHSFSSHTEPK